MSDSPDIQFTPSALAEAEKLFQQNASYKNLSLRVYIEGKGCDGFYYGVAFDDQATGDLIYNIGTLKVVMDGDSHAFLKGSTVDFIDDERGRGFLVINPNHNRFRGKFYKKPAFRAELEAKRQAKSQESNSDEIVTDQV